MAYVDADSSIRLLERIGDQVSGYSEPDRRYYHLLMIKATDKANRMTATPQQILQLVDYYQSDGDRNMLPEALYYAGRVYRTRNDAPEARRYFLQALEVIEAMPQSEENEYLKGKCYSQLGSIYLYQNLYEESAKMYQRAFDTNVEARDTVGMIFNLRDIANSYISLNKPDSSLIYAKRGLVLAEMIRDSLFINELYLLEAGACIQKEELETARRAFNQACSYNPGVESITQVTIGASLTYACDSVAECKRYASKLLEMGNIYDKRMASRMLAELAVREHNPTLALEMIRDYQIYDDSASNLNHAETILKMNALYDYSLRVEENRELRQANTRVVLIFSALVGLLLVVIAFAGFYIRYKRQQQQLMKLKIEKLEALKKANDAKAPGEIQREEEIVTSSEIYCRIKRLVNSPESDGGLSEDDWKDVSEVINRAYPGFTERLLDLCRMSENELRVSMLLKLGQTPTAIARLTYHSKESVSATRRRLFEKAFGQKSSPKDWDDFISTL